MAKHQEGDVEEQGPDGSGLGCRSVGKKFSTSNTLKISKAGKHRIDTVLTSFTADVLGKLIKPVNKNNGTNLLCTIYQHQNKC